MSMLTILRPVFPAFLALFVCFPVLAQKADDAGWVFKSEKEGVKVYYRHTTSVHELKLTTTIQTTVHGLIKLFAEAEHYPKWGYRILEARLLHRVSETEFYYYTLIDFPWPLSDRDIVMHARLHQNKDLSVVSSSKATPDYIPEVPGVVRIRESKTRWTLRPGPNGQLFTEYIVSGNPGGSIPDWAVNMALESAPLNTIRNIRKVVGQRQYQNARLAYLKDAE